MYRVIGKVSLLLPPQQHTSVIPGETTEHSLLYFLQELACIYIPVYPLKWNDGVIQNIPFSGPHFHEHLPWDCIETYFILLLAALCSIPKLYHN